LVLTACDAVSEHVPDDTMVIDSPDAVHTDVVVDVMVGATPDVADATTLNGVADHVRVPGFVNEIVFAAR
jgi:hypothetical protein